MPAVTSSAIRRIAYDSGRRELHVAFRESGAYVYFDVPPDEYQAMKAAPSKGAFLNERIKGRYRCARRGPPRRRIWLDEPGRPPDEKSA